MLVNITSNPKGNPKSGVQLNGEKIKPKALFSNIVKIILI